jgi:hypothetical protein
MAPDCNREDTATRDQFRTGLSEAPCRGGLCGVSRSWGPALELHLRRYSARSAYSRKPGVVGRHHLAVSGRDQLDRERRGEGE